MFASTSQDGPHRGITLIASLPYEVPVRSGNTGSRQKFTHHRNEIVSGTGVLAGPMHFPIIAGSKHPVDPL